MNAMNQISFRRVLIVFLAILLMSRTGKILKFFSDVDTDGVLTIEPLRESSSEIRYVVTLALCALLFTTIFCLLNKRK